ncbi:MAG: hypothetical protein JNL68_14335 [Burkholderiales bacterium]|nr:hypothetical protein [Burkholderiales bacterium]
MSTNKKAALGEDRAAQETQSSGSKSSTRDAKSSFAQAAIELVRASQRSCWISLSRDENARERWAELGLTLKQRDQAVQALVDSGEYEYEVDPDFGLSARLVERDRA